MTPMDRILAQAVAAGGSDVHMAQGRRPRFRVHGHLEDMPDSQLLDAAAIDACLRSIAPKERYADYLKTGDLDFAYEIKGLSRFRCNYFRSNDGLGAVFRTISDKVIPFEKLDLPPVLTRLARSTGGLLLVTGPTGSGKSTTLAALLDYINRHDEVHMILIEDPTEFVHTPQKAFITQREVGTHTKSFAAALEAALREDPDVIMVGEMRDMETTALALTAAEMGFLVFGTLHTHSAAKTIDRLVDVFPADRQSLVRNQLSASLLGVCSQTLLRTADGKGRIAAVEMLVATRALRKLILNNATHQVASFLQQGRRFGCQSMDDALAHYEAGKITKEAALSFMKQPERVDKPDPLSVRADSKTDVRRASQTLTLDSASAASGGVIGAPGSGDSGSKPKVRQETGPGMFRREQKMSVRSVSKTLFRR